MRINRNEFVTAFSFALDFLEKSFRENGIDRLERSLSHCVKGEENITAFPFLEKRENIIKYHHEAYDGSGFFGIGNDNIPLFAHIIALADMVEVAYQTGVGKDNILSSVANTKSARFSPQLCAAFASTARAPSFWLSLENMFVDAERKTRMMIAADRAPPVPSGNSA